MVEFIREDHITLANQRRNGRQVGGKATLEGDSCLDAFEIGQALFQLDMQRGRPGDGTHRTRPHSHLVDGGLGGLSQPGMVGQAQVVVGAEVEYPSPLDRYPAIHRTLNGTNIGQQPLFFERGQLLFHPAGFGHVILLESSRL
jgi:hypothetical protein